MRTREDIEEELERFSVRMDTGIANKFLLEAILDIRDLLANKITHTP